MKKQTLLAVFGSVVFCSTAMAVEAKIEVAVDAVLAPSYGYDDNDNVQVVVHGNLPNNCYRLDKTKVEKKISGQTIDFQVKQFAVRKTDGVCSEDNALPEHFNMLVPFTTVASVGSMPVGTYNFTFNKGGNQTGIRGLNVVRAKTPSVDEMPYAAISTAQVTDVAQKNEKLSLTLSGVLTSSCTTLDDSKISVKRVNDVFIVLPELTLKTGALCAQSLIPFSKTIDLGKVGKIGKVLVHTRAMGGQSVNNIVEVVDSN